MRSPVAELLAALAAALEASPEDVVAMKVLAGRPKDLHVVPPWRAPLSATA